MKVERFMKILNNTEVGLGNTNDSYIYIKQDYEIDFLFKGYVEQFKSKTDSKEYYSLRLTKSRETRIVGLGTYCREYNIRAGDAIILERIENNEKLEFIISHIKKVDTLVLQSVKKSKGFKIVSEIIENTNLYFAETDCYYKGTECKFSLKSIGSHKERTDSPLETEMYTFELTDMKGNNSISMSDEVASGDLIEIIKTTDSYFLKKIDSYFSQVLEL